MLRFQAARPSCCAIWIEMDGVQLEIVIFMAKSHVIQILTGTVALK